jgi:hypothetical protein
LIVLTPENNYLYRAFIVPEGTHRRDFVLMEFKKISIFFVAIMFCVTHNIVAQDTLSVEKASRHERKAKKEKTTVLDVSNDTLPVVVKSKVKRKGDTMKASMMSVVFPGGGQIYNRKYWKLPIVYAGFGGLIYSFSKNSTNYQLYYKGYMDFTDDIKETDSYIPLVPLDPETYDPVLYPESYNPANKQLVEEKMLRLVDYHKRYRDLSIILTGVWYMAQILDANVDASLMEYDVSDNLQLSFYPSMITLPGRSPGTGFNLHLTMAF